MSQSEGEHHRMIISRLRSSFKYRVKWAQLGVYYLRSCSPRSVRIAGQRVRLAYPAGEKAVQEHEFHKILIEDCYRLGEIGSPVRTVLDIGANIGLFAMAARNHFPKATINCYEPNPLLEPYLARHCAAVRAQYFMEAVGSAASRVSISNDKGSLHSTTVQRADCNIPQAAFSDAVKPLGVVDLLKLDCEGAEWEILSDVATWAKIQNVCMEYHLWAKPNATAYDVETALNHLGFTRIVISESGNGPWGFAFGFRGP